MRIDDSTYSRVVAWLKIALPLLALALLSTLFLVARSVDPAQDLPFAKVDVDEIAREQRISEPNYTGVTAEGASIELSAETALPESGSTRRIAGQKVRAGIELPDGQTINVRSEAMQLDYGSGTATLRENVVIETDRGYRLQTDALEVALDRTRVVSDGPTTLSADIGELSAGSFELRARDGSQRSYVLVFKDGVKLVYDPRK